MKISMKKRKKQVQMSQALFQNLLLWPTLLKEIKDKITEDSEDHVALFLKLKIFLKKDNMWWFKWPKILFVPREPGVLVISRFQDGMWFICQPLITWEVPEELAPMKKEAVLKKLLPNTNPHGEVLLYAQSVWEPLKNLSSLI